MKPESLEVIFIMLILPSFFALTMVAEGVWKLLKNESGWVLVMLGLGFMFLFVFVYFLVTKSVL